MQPIIGISIMTDLVKRLSVFILCFTLLANPGYGATLVSDGASSIPSEFNEDGTINESVVITLEDSLFDHQAVVQGVFGEVLHQPSGTTGWIELEEGDFINEGDVVKTTKNSYVELSYDESHLNYARIEEKTLIEFRTLEPTSVFIERGSLFNNLDGLVKGSVYEVETPTAVASVRGTSFNRSYDPDSSEDDTSVVEGVVDVMPVDEDGQVDRNQVLQVTQDQSFAIDRKSIREGRFHEVKPRALPEKRKQQLGGLFDRARERRVEFAGGPERAQKIHNHFKKLKANPQASAKIQRRAKISQKKRMHQAQRGNSPTGVNQKGSHDQLKKNQVQRLKRDVPRNQIKKNRIEKMKNYQAKDKLHDQNSHNAGLRVRDPQKKSVVQKMKNHKPNGAMNGQKKKAVLNRNQGPHQNFGKNKNAPMAKKRQGQNHQAMNRANQNQRAQGQQRRNQRNRR